MEYVKPSRLRPGDTVAIVSPSWGGPSKFPLPYEEGLRAIESLGLKVKEYPTARADADLIRANPKMRADDINAAFGDPEVKAIIASIGGNDSVRILPYLNRDVIARNPKVLMGYSDTTTLTTYCNQLGLVTFNGPSVMAGFSQWKSFPTQFHEHVQQILFGAPSEYEYQEYAHYADGYLDWSKQENIGKLKELKPADGWRWLQGSTRVQGRLFGGCIEVLEFMKGTAYWPEPSFWNGRILFFETSEEKPTPGQVKYMLRNYGMQGVYDKVQAILVGRARDYSSDEKRQLDETLVDIVANEFKRPDLPIISNMDFGHTDPQIILPLGVLAEIDCQAKTFKLLESPLK